MVIKMGRYGKFIACSNYPECKNTKPYLEKIGVDCPKCGGDLVQRKSRKGRVFYGCANYPECDFASWDKPVDRSCPHCEATLLFEKSRSSSNMLYCRVCGFQAEGELADPE